jgi:hypothetical protein
LPSSVTWWPGRPRFSAATLWASTSIPLAYGVYTLIRSPFITYTQDGEIRHWYPYHFINVDDLGYGRTLINIVGLLGLMLAVAGAYLVLDRKLPEGPRSAAIELAASS